MSFTDLESVKRLISAATEIRQRREIEQDAKGPFAVTILDRPKFEELERVAATNPGALVAVFSTLPSFPERMVVCQALASVPAGHSVISFWVDLAARETDQQLLACTAIALARWGEIDSLARLESRTADSASSQLVFYLGIARLILSDPRGVDYLIDFLEREAKGDISSLAALPTGGQTKKFVALSFLKRLFPEGPGDNIADWIPWWPQHRDRYPSVDCSMLHPLELGYAPPLSLFLAENDHIQNS